MYVMVLMIHERVNEAFPSKEMYVSYVVSSVVFSVYSLNSGSVASASPIDMDIKRYQAAILQVTKGVETWKW